MRAPRDLVARYLRWRRIACRIALRLAVVEQGCRARFQRLVPEPVLAEVPAVPSRADARASWRADVQSQGHDPLEQGAGLRCRWCGEYRHLSRVQFVADMPCSVGSPARLLGFRLLLAIAIMVASVVSTRRFVRYLPPGRARQKTLGFKSLGLASQAAVRALGVRPHCFVFLARVRVERYRLSSPRSRTLRGLSWP